MARHRKDLRGFWALLQIEWNVADRMRFTNYVIKNSRLSEYLAAKAMRRHEEGA